MSWTKAEERGTHPNFDIDVKCANEDMSSLTDKSMWMDVKLAEEGEESLKDIAIFYYLKGQSIGIHFRQLSCIKLTSLPPSPSQFPSSEDKTFDSPRGTDI